MDQVAKEMVGPAKSIEEVFDIIQGAIEQQYDRIEVTYDPHYGFPSLAHLNRRVPGGLPSTHKITDFRTADSELTDYFAARHQWGLLKMKHYRYTQSFNCECRINTIIDVSVFDHQVTSAYLEEQSQELETSEIAQRDLNIFQLFDLIYKAISEGRLISVEYQVETGLPEHIVLTDGDGSEVEISVQNFEKQKTEKQLLLESQRQKWAESKPDEYSYVFQLAGNYYGNKRYRAWVTDGEISDAVYLIQEDDLPDITDAALSIEGIFDLAESWLEEYYFSVEIIYDEEFGYPKYLYADRLLQFIDDELDYRVDHFLLTNANVDEAYKNLRLWRSQNHSQYSFQIEWDCQCDHAGTFRIHVDGYNIFVDQIKGDRVEYEDQRYVRRRFELWYSYIDALLSSPESWSDVVVNYDAELGFPTLVSATHKSRPEASFTATISLFEVGFDP